MKDLPDNWGSPSHSPPDLERDYPRGSLQWTSLNLWLGGVEIDQQPAHPLRFRLWELMVVMTVAAALLALFRALGIIGAAIAFFAALGFTNLAYPQFNRDSPARQAAMFDFIWGAVMPLVCLTFDPFVFKYGDINLHQDFNPPNAELFRTASVYPWSWPVYAIVGWQLGCLGTWLALGRLPAGWSAACAGMLWVGFVVATIVGIVLLIPAGLAAPAGIGFLGFTPLFTARAYYRRSLMAASAARQSLGSTRHFLALGGFVAALLVPGAFGLLVAVLLGTGS